MPASGRVTLAAPPDWALADPVLLAAYRAAFHGRPADGVAALTQGGGLRRPTPEVRWLAGVCLGAQGRYRQAASALCPPGHQPDSLAASTLASHRRQIGRHADAERLDTLAAALAPAARWPEVALADALVGLVADAVGRADPAAGDRLARARDHVAGLDPVGYWRAHVRLGWVAAEYAMLRGDPATARTHAADALRRARAAAAPRHRAKSLLVLGVAASMLGRPDAARTLAAAARRAERLGVPTLAWPAWLVLARVRSAVDPVGSRAARNRADVLLRAVAAGLESADAERFLGAHQTG